MVAKGNYPDWKTGHNRFSQRKERGWLYFLRFSSLTMEEKGAETTIGLSVSYSVCKFTKSLIVMSFQESPGLMTTFLSIV